MGRTPYYLNHLNTNKDNTLITRGSYNKIEIKYIGYETDYYYACGQKTIPKITKYLAKNSNINDNLAVEALDIMNNYLTHRSFI